MQPFQSVSIIIMMNISESVDVIIYTCSGFLKGQGEYRARVLSNKLAGEASACNSKTI